MKSKIKIKTWLIKGVLILCTSLYAQSDNIVSKSTGFLFSQDSLVWVFDGDNLSYSVINFFTAPPEVYTYQRKRDPFIAATFVGSSVLGAPIENSQGDSRELKLIQTWAEELTDKKRRVVLKLSLKDTNTLDEVLLSDVLVTGSSVLLALGEGGLGSIQSEDGNAITDRVTLEKRIQFLQVEDSVSQLTVSRCDFDKDECSVNHFPLLKNSKSVVSVDVIGKVEFKSDSVVILMGSHRNTEGLGLRRLLLGDSVLTPVTSQNLDTASVRKIFVNPNNQMVWVFTDDGYFMSMDGGLNFKTPKDIQSSQVISLRNPEVAFHGDTTLVNFDFSSGPGLVLYVRDSLIKTSSSPEELFSPMGLDLPKDIELGSLTFASFKKKKVVVVGTKSQGVHYRLEGDKTWRNINKHTKVGKNLKEIITFPTLFNGTEDVGLGYQLEKSGKITIKVYNYAMEEVRTIVTNSSRVGGSSRSEDPQVDKWDGKDDRGQLVSSGMYYILLESSTGEKGWGKVMVVVGRK